jgi:NTE family protein
MTDVAKFTAAAAGSVAIARALKEQHKEFSDMIDDEGNQYVDLVMEGGGVLGIALTGYTYVLEQAGIRFLGVGGTSAGSINALMIAALDVPSQPKSEKLLATLADMPMDEFIDGDSDARDFSHAILRKRE